MAHIVRVAVTQMSCCMDKETNVATAEQLVRDAAKTGANIVLLPELFEGLYFCQEQKEKYFDWAHEEHENLLIRRFSNLAKEFHVVLPISFFEKSNNAYFNSIVVIDADGSIIGKYRKSHIPDGPGYQEKFYFSPGDTGFRVFQTAYGKLGLGICWDQWFPECARALVLNGAELLLYPTAIGSEPMDHTYDSSGHWTRTMQGHSAANMVPVIASNRVGTETFENSSITFYGSGFITSNTGDILHQLDRISTTIALADFDLARNEKDRRAWGMFRDRRPDLYGVLLTRDGGGGVK